MIFKAINTKQPMKVEFMPELCCEICNDVIHVHFKCPSCGDDYAGTSIYGDLYDHDEEFNCLECGARFKLIDRSKGIIKAI